MARVDGLAILAHLEVAARRRVNHYPDPSEGLLALPHHQFS
jgi:hypothetical protein